MSVDPVFGNDQVALRGPWRGDNLVQVAPTADDVASGRDRYHLDFPGNALSPKCDYEAWQQSLPTVPTTYAHVVSEEGQTALQYWFFYVYNDYNDRHEGDWEMIQLELPGRDRGGGGGRRARPRPASRSTTAVSGRPGVTRSSSWSTARTRSSTRRPGRTRTTSGRPSTSAGVRRRASAATTRAGPRASSGRASSWCRRIRSPPPAVPVDRLPGVLGRGAGDLQQRPDRARAPTTSGIIRSSGRRRAGTRRRSRSRARSTACRARRACSAGPSPRARPPSTWP